MYDLAIVSKFEVLDLIRVCRYYSRHDIYFVPCESLLSRASRVYTLARAEPFASNSSDSNINPDSYFIFKSELSTTCLERRPDDVYRFVGISKICSFMHRPLPRCSIALFFSFSPNTRASFSNSSTGTKTRFWFLFNSVLYIFYSESQVHAYVQTQTRAWCHSCCTRVTASQFRLGIETTCKVT